MKVIIAAVFISPLLIACAIAPAAAPAETSPPPDRYVGTTRWVNAKYPIRVCADPPADRSSIGTGCKAAAPGTALMIDRALFVYKYDIPIPNGYAVTDSAGKVGFISFTDVAMMDTEARRKEAAAKTAECDRRGGVAIGMSRAQVYASCWGKPKTVNQTTTATRNHEQMVYGGGYVYLDNGVVTSIQTSH